MQWRRQKRVTHVIGSSNHVLLLARYQDAPPGEEDEEDGLRKDFSKSQDKDSNAHTFERNGQSAYKPRRAGTGTSSSASNYTSSCSRSHRDENSGSPVQPKIIFNEDEYTRITTPRQDVLFKKGYLSRKKPWTGNASTSATPSTTESQSASHSTADGSETTEDQQLLDRDSGTGEYPPVAESGAQLGYGTFYDHTSGYYYECPVMFVGPAPTPHVGPSILAAVPCGPVPLRPIEWINPAFMPKLANQPYCLMDYQTRQGMETVTIVEEQNGAIVTATEAPNGTWSGTGSASCSVAGEIEEQAEDSENATTTEQQVEQLNTEEQQHLKQHHQHLEGQEENGRATTTTVDSYIDPLMIQEAPLMHMPHVVPATSQPYMYPGHYMFGPPVVSVNGVTIQGGPLVRTMDVSGMTMAYAKRRKKRKKRKQKKLTTGNTEDDEEGEYSSECDNDVSSSRLPWLECPTTTTVTTTTKATKSRPLNPECQEFQPGLLQNQLLSNIVSTATVADEITMIVNDALDAQTCPAEEITMTGNDISDALSCPAAEEVTIVNAVSNTLLCSAAENELTVSHRTPEELLENVHSSAKQENVSTIRESSQEVITKQTLSDNVYQFTNYVETKSRTQSVENNGFADSMENMETVVTNDIIKELRSNTPNCGEESSSRIDSFEESNETISNNSKCDLLKSKDKADATLLNNHADQAEESLTNGIRNLECFNELTERTSVPKSRSISPQTGTAFSDNSYPSSAAVNADATTVSANTMEEAQRLHHCNNSSIARTTLLSTSPRKFSKKGPKFVRESTPGPDLDEQTSTRTDVENGMVVRQFEAIDLSDDMRTACMDQECRAVTSDHLDQADQESSHEENVGDNDDKIKTSQNAIMNSDEDSIERKTLFSKYPITKAVTEWLRRSKSPDTLLFKLTSTLKCDTMMNEDDEEMDVKPSKNLQGNPMPALSANSCGEFAKTNNNNNIKNIEQVETNGISAIGRCKRDAIGTSKRKVSAMKKMNKRNSRNNVDERKTQNQMVSSLVSCHRLVNVVTAVKLRDPLKNNVGDVCEFTQEDSVAGMRVALSSRINSKRVSIRRAKILRRIKRNPVENIDIRMRRIDDAKHNENGYETIDNSVSVRTFEKGEIIVSKDGKLLPTFSYEPVSPDISDKTAAYAVDVINENIEKFCEIRDSSENDENMMSSVSIEEPDVLECWEAETIEPVITSKRILQSPGVLCEGEAVEDDNFEIEKTTIENVQKYYRLDSAISIEEDSSVLDIYPMVSMSKSRIVPNNPEKMIEHIRVEEIPIFMPDKSRDVILENEKIFVDEAFEAYESCYNGGKSSFLTSFDSKIFKKQQPLYIQNGERPIPCRKVCCNIQ